MGSVSYTTTTSDNFVINPGVLCALDITKNYYRANTDNVLIGCTLTNNVILGDNIYLTFTSDSYTLNSDSSLNCISLSPISTVIHLSSTNMLVLKISAFGNFSGNRK